MTDYPPKITNTPGDISSFKTRRVPTTGFGASSGMEAPGEPSILSVLAAAGGLLLSTLAILFLFEALR